MILLIEYYKSDNPVRDSEYLYCIEQNINNKFIEKIIVFISDVAILNISHSKLETINMTERPTYQYLFEYANENFPNKTIIISNTDIFFDETLDIIKKYDMTNMFLALTRWDYVPTGRENQFTLKFFNVDMSQDSWIFKTPIKMKEVVNFTCGVLGCDNRIARIAYDSDYDVRNPALQIKITHIHNSGHRTYRIEDTIKGKYLYLVPNNNINMITVKREIGN